MRSKFVFVLRACGVAAILIWSIGRAAEINPASLVGATRAQVLQQLGEPRSSLVAGNREVLLFDRERVVLRNNVVVEAELRPAEPVRVAPPPAASEVESEDETRAEAEGEPAEPTNNEVRQTPAVVTPPADGPLEIRSVRPAGTRPARTAPKTETGAAPTTSVAPTRTDAPAVDPGAQTAPSGAVAPAVATPAPSAVESAPGATNPSTPVTEETTEESETPAVEETDVPAKAAGPRPPRAMPEIEDPPLFTTRSYVIAFVIVGGGIGYLIWRARQRRLELAATAVSRTPFAVPTTSATAGARFTTEFLAKLEWKRFEQLVAAYYGKTGVVAARTNTGPTSPVHIKISWKGETRPFAYVQCIAHPAGLVDAKPIQELVASLMADDIRRGYVVTTGKFNVPARDFAEEKAITLLPGDIFVEKLNALPDGARNELMHEIATGDYTTPSCPTCDAKMVRAPDDPSLWRCPAHPEITIPAWK